MGPDSIWPFHDCLHHNRSGLREFSGANHFGVLQGRRRKKELEIKGLYRTENHCLICILYVYV